MEKLVRNLFYHRQKIIIDKHRKNLVEICFIIDKRYKWKNLVGIYFIIDQK